MSEYKTDVPMTAYKGMDGMMRCRDHQYEVGQTEKMEEPIKLCRRGFHACRRPVDVLEFYFPEDSRYFEVEQSGVIDELEFDSTTNQASSIIRVVKELGIEELAQKTIEYNLYHPNPFVPNYKFTNEHCGIAEAHNDHCVAVTSSDIQSAVAIASGSCSVASSSSNYGLAFVSNESSIAITSSDVSVAAATNEDSAACVSGSYSIACTTGGCTRAQASGRFSVACTSNDDSTTIASGVNSLAISAGFYSTSYAEGDVSVAVTTGPDGRVHATKVGQALFAIERGPWDGSKYPIISAAGGVVDGCCLKPGKFYECKRGVLVEVE